MPEVIWPLSSERVITTEFVPGVHIDKARCSPFLQHVQLSKHCCRRPGWCVAGRSGAVHHAASDDAQTRLKLMMWVPWCCSPACLRNDTL